MSDASVRKYRRAELDEVLSFDDADGFRIKLISDAGETKWLSVSRDEVVRIADILAEGSES